MMKIKINQFYVYAHYLDGVCMYVGKGTKGRAFNTNNRAKKWKKFLAKKDFTVHFLGTYDLSIDAENAEMGFIKELEPLANVRRGKPHSSTTPMMLRLNQYHKDIIGFAADKMGLNKQEFVRLAILNKGEKHGIS